MTEEIEDGMDETGEIDTNGNRPIRSLLLFRMSPHPERRTSIGMSRKHIDVSVDTNGMMSAILTIIIVVMVVPRARVICLHLTNELDGIDTIMTILDLLLLRLALTSVLCHLLLNLPLGLILPIPD